MRILPVLLTIGLGTFGCRPFADLADYTQTCHSAATAIPVARQMEELFGDADHFITHYGFDYGPKPWQTVVFFGGRYTLTMEVEVDIDYRHNTVRQRGTPKFHLIGVDTLTRDPSGTVTGALFRGDERWLTEEEWRTVYKSDGDFSAIGVALNPAPIPGFDEYVQGMRTPRIPIRLIP